MSNYSRHTFESLFDELFNDRMFGVYGHPVRHSHNVQPQAVTDRSESAVTAEPVSDAVAITSTSLALTMPVEFEETDSTYEVRADLPGVSLQDINVKIRNGTLTLSAKRASSREETSENNTYYHSERSYGSVSRSFSLPETVDHSTSKASFENGVLSVVFQKSAEDNSHSIPINA